MVTHATGQLDGGLRWLVSAVFLVCSLEGAAILVPGIVKAEGKAVASLDHSAWKRILEQYVDEDGFVAYKRLGNQDREQLDGYLARLADAKPQEMEVNERIAFWINAYNAGIVAAILDGYSPESTLSRTRRFCWYTQVEKQESQRGSATESVDGPEKKVCEIPRRAAGPAAGDPGYCTGELNG